MYCIRCGKQIEDGSNYCMYCGARIEQTDHTDSDLKKEDRPVSAEDSSNRVDDFEIRLPDDFMTRKAEPDEAESLDYTRPVNRQDILDAIAYQKEEPQTAPQPDEAESLDYTRPVNRQDILDAMAYQKEEAQAEPQAAPQPDEPESLDYTRPVNRQDILDAMADKPKEENRQDDVEDLLRKKKVYAAKQDILEALEAISKEQPSYAPSAEVLDIPIPADFIKEADAADEVPKPEEKPAERPQEHPWNAAPHAAENPPEQTEEVPDIPVPDDFMPVQDDADEAPRTEEKPAERPQKNPWNAAPHAAENPPKKAEEVPDIPIPDNFMQAPPKLGEEFAETEPAAETEGTEESEEPAMTRRGILTVVLVVVLLFSIAAGACISMMSGNIPVSSQSEDAGSAADFQTQQSVQDE